MLVRKVLLIFLAFSCLYCFSDASRLRSQEVGKVQQDAVVKADGTVEIPAHSVPLSGFLTPEAKSYVTEHLENMQDAALTKQENGVPLFMKHYLERDEEQFALDRKDEKLAGVHVYTYVPKAGIASANQKRVLINLHGGGFSGCWPGCAELESMPISALMRIKVVSVDYREGPEYKFPAASEDVAKVYAELLKTYKPKDIGIYGCSAGGMLTAMSLAWFQSHGLPTPGADGIFCASAGPFGGDANYIAFPMGEARMPAGQINQRRLGYFSDADMNDPLVQPSTSTAVLAKFPPTLIITATRDFAMSGAINTDILLTKAGVHSELHVWDGLFHGFFYNADIPESKEAFTMMIAFFDKYLGKG
ncbi:MAG: alpha/beta hydrolase [Acidobacteria bacterium]|nr:alpha/beta hydrolase [Acidobacteriota bacterium]